MSIGGFDGGSTTPEVIVNRVMVVEDDVDTAEFLKTLLEQHRFDVVVAKDGGQAQGLFLMKKPDFVLLDLILPGESGFEVCERLKQTDRSVPVLILTAIDMHDSFNLAKRVGADAYLTKPFEPDHLIKMIRDTARKVWQRVREEWAPEEEDRRIRFACKCGKKFKVSPTHRGKTLTCPKCGETVVVPRHN